MQLTPENLIENYHNINRWLLYALATTALNHYFPDETTKETTSFEYFELLQKLGLYSWGEVVEKYHNEVGYTPDQLNGAEIFC